MESFPVLLL